MNSARCLPGWLQIGAGSRSAVPGIDVVGFVNAASWSRVFGSVCIVVMVMVMVVKVPPRRRFHETSRIVV